MIMFKLKDNVVSQVVVPNDTFNLCPDVDGAADSDGDKVTNDMHFPLNATSAKLLHPYAMAEIARLEMINQEHIVDTWNELRTDVDNPTARPDRPKHIAEGYTHAIAIGAFIEAFSVPELGLPQDEDLSTNHIRALSKLVDMKVSKMIEEY